MLAGSAQPDNQNSGNRPERAALTVSDIVVDVEFYELIPRMSDEDRIHFLSNIERDGFRDPLVVWSHENEHILLDGHNRLDLWRTAYEGNGDVSPPPIHVIDLPDRNAAVRWIITNQFGRRNLTTMQRAELAVLLEPAIAEQAKKNQQQSQGRGAKGSPKSDNLLPVRTDEAAAKLAGIGKDTYRKAKTVLAEADPETLAKARSGEISINKAHSQVVGKSQNSKPQSDVDSPTTPDAKEDSGRAIELAQEAIKHLESIPKNDPLRSRGLEIVEDFIKHQEGGCRTLPERGIGSGALRRISIKRLREMEKLAVDILELGRKGHLKYNQRQKLIRRATAIQKIIEDVSNAPCMERGD